MAEFRFNAIIIGAIVALVLLVNVIIGIKHYKIFSTPLKWLVAYLAFSLVCEVLSSILFVQRLPNLWLINLYTIGEFILISVFITQLTQNTATRRKWFYRAIALVTVGYLLYFGFLKSFTSFSSYSETVENILLMSLCIYFFTYSLSNRPQCFVEEEKLVKWTIVGLFIYLSGIVLIWLAYEFLAVVTFRDTKYFLIYSNGFISFGFKLIVLIALLSFDHTVRRKKILGKPKRKKMLDSSR